MTTDTLAARRHDDLPSVARLLSLSDNVVAFALTLLVLQVKVPAAAQVADPGSAADLAAQLAKEADQLISYVIAPGWPAALIGGEQRRQPLAGLGRQRRRAVNRIGDELLDVARLARRVRFQVGLADPAALAAAGVHGDDGSLAGLDQPVHGGRGNAEPLRGLDLGEPGQEGIGRGCADSTWVSQARRGWPGTARDGIERIMNPPAQPRARSRRNPCCPRFGSRWRSRAARPPVPR